MNSENTSWHEKSTPHYPPPEKKPKRRLSLKAAMALATGAPGHEMLMPLVRKNDENLAGNEDSRKRVETYLLDLQADIINREELLDQREKLFAAREKDMIRRANVFRKKTQEIESRSDEIESAALSDKEESATEPLEDEPATEVFEDESDADFFEETREMLRRREAYIEECENALVKKLTELTQREAEIEQREENFEYKAKQFQQKG